MTEGKRLIAGLYEISEKIGAGGGGIVYLGRHVRLNKTVVLKADRRSLKTDEVSLRREVDLLKSLSHTYIPQVYDFVQENGVVYTVMDYIDGESLDKLLDRKVRPSQSQIIKWACQLLDALQYLHSQPPYGILHGDIKPANIMLRPSGDICLIDYNIALALGEDGAVKVGFSRGYASPEHYSSGNAETISGQYDNDRTELITPPQTNDVYDRTEVLADSKTESSSGGKYRWEGRPPEARKSHEIEINGYGKKGVRLDVRSDVYSLGATLYHLLSGRRPAERARDVVPLGRADCSPAVSVIISKAMAERPEDRYQSAHEMLEAFRRLHKTDLRVIHRKRRICAASVLIATAFAAGGFMTFVGLKQLEQRQNALTLAEYSANALAEGNVSRAVSLAMQALPLDGSIFNALPTAEAQKALTDALGVYDLSDSFKAVDVLQLPSEPFDVFFSPHGTRLAAVYAYETAIYDPENNKLLAVFPMRHSALADAAFLGESRMIFAGENGVSCADIDSGSILWTADEATRLSVSEDENLIAAACSDNDGFVILDANDGNTVYKGSFDGLKMQAAYNDTYADPGNTVFSLDEKGEKLAVSFSDGAFRIFDIKNAENDLILFESSEYSGFTGGFCGKYCLLSAGNERESQFLVVDTEKAEIAAQMQSQDPFTVRTDGKRYAYVANGGLLVSFDTETMEQTELAYDQSARIVSFDVSDDYALITTDDGRFAFYNRTTEKASEGITDGSYEHICLSDKYAALGTGNSPDIRMMSIEDHADAELVSYDSGYSHDEARITDNNRAMLYDYSAFRIVNMNGAVVAEYAFPDPDRIYDQQFRRIGDRPYLEVIWYDGTVRQYSAEDGRLLSETVDEAPSMDLHEDFETDRYIISMTLHSPPEVRDKESGKLIKNLETDAKLTYVTQVDEGIITEYINTQGERYGLLLNDKLETLAVMPDLCDVSDNRVIFDYSSGNLRQSRIYSLQELIALGEAYKE